LHRKSLIEKIENYRPEFEREKEFRALFLSFINKHSNCFERSLSIGHITGSAWIVDLENRCCLLTHHKKLNKWLQLGGHADGDSDIIGVSRKEAIEESGLKSLELVSENIFDIDIHTIPARKNEPEHLHYDIRFLFIADKNEPLVVSKESKDLAWVSYEELNDVCKDNESIIRMAIKSKKGALSPKLP